MVTLVRPLKAALFVMTFMIILENFIDRLVAWLSQLDWASVLLWIAIGLVAVVLITLVVTYSVSCAMDEHFAKTIEYEASGARVYRIDSINDNVTYFDLSRISQKKNVSLKRFYSSFPAEEQDKVRTWVESILSGKQTPDFLQTNVYLRSSKKNTSSYLKITKSDPSNGLLHLESYLLQTSTKKKTSSIAHPFVSENQFATSLKEHGASNGTTFCFSLKRKKVDGYDNNVPRTVCSKFRLALDHYLSGNTKLMKLSENQLLVCNFDINDPEEAVAYALRTVNGVNNALSSKLKNNEPTYVLKAGVVSNKDVYGDPDAIMESSQRTSVHAYETDSSLSFYKKGFDDFTNFDVSKYRSEVERIIFDKRINNYFRPVYGVSRHSVLGYMAKAVPDADRTSFSTIEELKNYAIRAKDQNNLFGYLAKTIVSRFVSERPLRSQRLFYPVMMRELPTIPAIFGNLRGAKEANIMFLLQESDLNSSVRSLGMNNVINMLKDIHETGFAIGMILKGKSLSADDAILKLMDIFFVDFHNDDTDSKHMDMAIRSQLHALVERLLKYKRIFVGTDLPDWNAIELVVGSGIDYVASDVFGPYQSGFVPLNEKDELRLKEMKGNKQ